MSDPGALYSDTLASIPEEGPFTPVPMKCPACGARTTMRGIEAMMLGVWCACGEGVFEFDAGGRAGG